MILQRRPGRAHLLVVDDEESYRTALEIGLGAEGYEVRTVEDGRSCLAAVEHEPVDLVVLDMMLPDLPGLEICGGWRRPACRSSWSALDAPRSTSWPAWRWGLRTT